MSLGPGYQSAASSKRVKQLDQHVENTAYSSNSESTARDNGGDLSATSTRPLLSMVI